MLAFYLASLALALAAWRAGGLGPWSLPVLAVLGAHLVWQALTLKVHDPAGALRLFRSNTLAGVLLFVALVAGRWR